MKKSIEDTYQKKTPLQHIIDLPDTYIGSVEKTELDTWVYNQEENKIEFKNIEYIPGLYKIFDEVLVNAIDDKIYNLNAVIDRSKYNKVWYDQIIVLYDIKKRLKKTV